MKMIGKSFNLNNLFTRARHQNLKLAKLKALSMMLATNAISIKSVCRFGLEIIS